MVRNIKNPENLLEKVVKFLYNGELDYKMEEIPALCEIAIDLTITVLQDELAKHIRAYFAEKECLKKLVDIRYQKEYRLTLEWLQTILTENFRFFTVAEWSALLDVSTFCGVLANVKDGDQLLKPEDRLAIIKEFLGEYNFPDPKEMENEKAALRDLFERDTRADVKWISTLHKDFPIWWK